jgi:hypothetical protein
MGQSPNRRIDMQSSGHSAIASLSEIFGEEVAARGGIVVDTFVDRRAFYGRAALPRTRAIAPGDDAQGGVALRATDGGVWVHPYILRLVCSNGLIAPSAFSTRYASRDDLGSEDEVMQFVRLSIASCCADDKHAEIIERLQWADDLEADLFLAVASMSACMEADARARVMEALLDCRFVDAARTLFDHVNRVTAAARDAADPRSRWDLEELGGALLYAATPRKPLRGEREAPERVAAASAR